MARFNTVSRTLSINTTTVFTYAFTGGLITLGGSPGYTVTLVDPRFAPGQVQNFYNSTAGNITLSAPAGGSVITGPALTSAVTQIIPTTAVFSLTSNGTNYILTNDEGGPLLATTATVSDTLAVTNSATSPIVRGSTASSGTLTLNSTSNATKATAGILMSDGIASTSTITGTLVVTGGAGVSGQINVGGATNTFSGGTASTGTGNGTVVVTGGLGVSGRINATDFTGTIGANTRSAGSFTTLDANNAVGLSPANQAVTISPTGTGTVSISPAGALTINPTAASTINNTSIGATTASTGRFTTLTVSSTISANGSVGSAGQVLTSQGAGQPAQFASVLVNGTSAYNSSSRTVNASGQITGYTIGTYVVSNITYSNTTSAANITSYNEVEGGGATRTVTITYLASGMINTIVVT